MEDETMIDNDDLELLESRPVTNTATDAYDDDSDEIDLEFGEQEPPRCTLTTGAAGTGKTYYWRERIRNDPGEGLLCATTGIAGVNLNTTTINAQLKYFDTDSMLNAYVSGRLVTRLARIGSRVRNLVIDEVSMMPAEQLDTLYQAVQEANRRKAVTKTNPDGLGIVLVGDLCQLPPIKSRWIFEAECWPQFDEGTTRLEKNWRQRDGTFLDAVNALRAGEGQEGASLLSSTTTEFSQALDLHFPGTTIMAKNDEVDRFNWQALQRVAGEKFIVKSSRWCAHRPPGEWKNIPERVELKVGAYVMILANSRERDIIINYGCSECNAQYDQSAYLRILSEPISSTGASQVLQVEQRAASESKNRIKPETVLQSELRVPLDKAEQSDLDSKDESATTGELRGMEGRSVREKAQVEREGDARIRDALQTGASERNEDGICFGASVGSGGKTEPLSRPERTGPSSQQHQERQSTGEPRINLDRPAASRENRVSVLSARFPDSVACPACGNGILQRHEMESAKYANGDCGLIVGRSSCAIQIRLARNDQVVEIGTIDRHVHATDPDEVDRKRAKLQPTWGEPWFDERSGKYVVGTVRYLPLRLAYASTVHKSQGLTLDRVQLDLRNHFFSSPAMTYVSVSRCRTPEGLRIVGTPELLASRCRIDPRVKRWI